MGNPTEAPTGCTMSVMLTCRDVKSSVDFYTRQLGFEMKEAWPSRDDPAWCSLVLEGQTVMLGGTPDSDGCGAGEEIDDAHRWMMAEMERFKGGTPGAGAFLYVQVPDIDAFHERIVAAGAAPAYAPKTQFYGIRESAITDPSGYQLIFFTPVAMTSCQSCGMPLTDAVTGQMYCTHCVDENGQLRPYEQILEGTITGYFMGMQKMERPEAEKAAREHLASMPAWQGQAQT